MPSPEQKRSDSVPCEPIAIVGMDCVFPGAPNLADFWRNVVLGTNCLTPIPLKRWNQLEIHDLPRVPGGFIHESVEFDPLPFGIMPAEVEEGDPEQFLVLSIIERALRDLKNSSGRQGIQVLSPERTELVIGRGGYLGNGVEHVYLRMEVVEQITELLGQILPGASKGFTEEIRKRLVAALPPVRPEVVACAVPNLTSGRAANRLNIMGRNCTVDAACASSLLAVDSIVRSLRERRCDLGIAAGLHIIQKPHFWLVFQTLGALSRSGVCRPFAADADGLLMGEGVGAVVLKRLSDALRDGDRIYAAIRAVGVASDGRGTAVMTPRVEGEVLAIQRAYDEAGIDPQRVTLVEGHGTATVVGDSTEIDALHAIFGKEGSSVALGSVKSMIGHAMPAAGMAGLIKTALAIYHGLLPPTLNVERVHPKLEGSRFCVNTVARPWVSPPESPRTAGVNAFGFGGINAHVILEEVANRPTWESITPQSSELFLASAESPAQLLERLQLWSHRAATLRDEDLGDICFTEMGRVADAHPVRLAMVVKSIAELRAKLEQARAGITAERDESQQDPSGLYYGSSRYGGKLAFLFPGFGFPGLAGGYATRLAELYLHFPEIRKNLDMVDSLTKDETAGLPLSYQMFPPPGLDRDTLAQIERDLAWSERSPIGMSMANMASWDLLQLFALQPDAMAGFSLGELSALFASEVIDREHFNLDTLRQMRSAIKASSQPSEDAGALWAMVATSAEQAETIMHQIPGEVTVTMDVSPSQVFIGGDKAAVRAALQKFQDAGIWGQALPVFPLLLPFLTVHTEMAAPFEAQLRAMVETIPLGSSRCPVYSGTTATPYPESAEAIREMILASVTQRVRIRDTIAQLYADGVRIFVQLGAGGKMLSNIENTLEGSDYVALSTDLPHRSSLEQLHHLLGRLATLGVPFQLSALYRYRRCKPIDFEKTTVAASTGARRLSLTPPRLRLSAEDAEWIRAQYAVELPQPKPVAPESGALAHLGEQSITEQSLAMMGRFLDVQRSWEETENELLEQFLETQVRATSVLSSAPAPQGASSIETASVTWAELRTERPLVGEIQRLVPGLELESRLVLDLSQHLFLSHHAFLNIPDGLKPVEERLPTLPLTFELEILCEVTEALVPELRVIACHDLEAKRWISFESTPTLEVTIRARRVADSEVEVELYTEGHNAPAFLGHATLGVALPTPPAALEQVYDRNCPHTAAEFYRKGPLFHGPMFQLIRSFRGMSDRDIGAQLVASDPREYFTTSPRANLLLDPLLLDGLQQIVGYRAWLDGWFVMPIGMKRLSLYGPPPAPGSPIRASVRYRRIDGRRIEADYEAYDAAGQMWIRVDILQDWRVFYPKTLTEANHRPREGFLARPWPIGQPEITCYRVSSDYFGDVKPGWMAQFYLRADEWAMYRQKPALDWLLGRIAAKDAVRDWLRQHKGMLLHPLEVEIVNQADGAPRLLVPRMPSLAISIAHTEDEAIAIVSQAPGVGVDLAAVKERGREFSDFAFRDDELSSLPQSSRDVWIHRGWCAKEAAVKAFRLGFAELPQLRIVAVEERTGAVEMECKPRGIKIAAATWLDQDRTIAVVVPAS